MISCTFVFFRVLFSLRKRCSQYHVCMPFNEHWYLDPPFTIFNAGSDYRGMVGNCRFKLCTDPELIHGGLTFASFCIPDPSQDWLDNKSFSGKQPPRTNPHHEVARLP